MLGHRTIPEIQAQARVEFQAHFHVLRNIPMPPTYATQVIASGAHLIDQNVRQLQFRELRIQKNRIEKHSNNRYVLSLMSLEDLIDTSVSYCGRYSFCAITHLILFAPNRRPMLMQYQVAQDSVHRLAPTRVDHLRAPQPVERRNLRDLLT